LLEIASAEFKAAHAKFADAERAEHAARPPAPPALRSTKRNLAEVTCYALGRTARCAISSAEIRHEIARVKSNSVKAETSGGVRHIIVSDAGFPLTGKQRARLARLETKLAVAEAYEAKCRAIKNRFRVEELNVKTDEASDRQVKILSRLVKLLARNRDDLLAKVGAYQAEYGLFHGEGGGEDHLAHSIVRDVQRLTANSII
jgi:hypothetical protein